MAMSFILVVLFFIFRPVTSKWSITELCWDSKFTVCDVS